MASMALIQVILTKKSTDTLSVENLRALRILHTIILTNRILIKWKVIGMPSTSLEVWRHIKRT